MEPLERFDRQIVLHEQSAVRQRQRLVEAEDGPLSETAERPPIVVLAQERQRAVFDEQHFALSTQLRELSNRL
jgi:hypothetical protein